jgi:hypothetical protein
MDELPPYNNARGFASSLQLVPPFLFKDVTMSVFPLRANLPRLQSFCDAYLNRATDLFVFEPFVPYVYLIVLDYGKMATEVANMGWVSQIEVAFSVPLKWMTVRDGKPHFHDWAVNCPFIFVDNELSMTTGREVFGWPKLLTRLEPKGSQWVTEPHGVRTEFQVSTKTFAQNFQGERAEHRPLLSVRRRPAPNFLDMPVDLRGLLEPLAQAPRAAQSMLRLGMDLAQTLRGVGWKQALRLDAPAHAGSLPPPRSMFRQAYANTINLKQFRDASSPWTACYQSLTNTRMGMESIHRGGMLGQQNLAFGQIDGGYTIDLHRYASLPIVDALGLEVAESRMDGDVSVSSMTPVAPFWMKLDMHYGQGQVLAWRTRAAGWQPAPAFATRQADSARSAPAPEPEVPPADWDTEVDDDLSALPIGNLFNTARGAAAEAVAGPFALPNTTIRVLPLLADPAVLSRFVERYLGVQGHARFEAWGSFVYLIAYTYPQRSSEVNNVGTFAHREVNFSVPVKWYDWYEPGEYDLSQPEERERRDREKLQGVALVNAFSFVDDPMVAITSSEIDGIPTLSAEIQSPPSLWMDPAGPAKQKGESLLSVSSLVLPSIGVGAGGERKVLLNVSTAALLPAEDEAGWREVADKWGPQLMADMKAKRAQRGERHEQWSTGPGWDQPGGERASSFDHVRALALAVLSGELPLSSLSLKQFRDAEKTDSACYQSIVLGRQRIKRLHEVHDIEELTHVLIARFPTQPIKELLGLRVKLRQFGSDGMVEAFEAVRPFWLRADLAEDLGCGLFERAGTQDWRLTHRPEQLAGWRSVPSAAALEGLEGLERDPAAPALVSYAQSIEGRFQRVVWELGASDHRMLHELQRKGEIRHLKVRARRDRRTVLAGTRVLNHIDRVHVPDLAAFVNAQKTTSEPDRDASAAYEQRLQHIEVRDLAVDLGRIDPATVLDSIISRQWGRPATARDRFDKPDFAVHIEALGPGLRERIFPQDERQGVYWPRSRDFRSTMDQERQGMAYQCWDQVWTLIRLGAQTDPEYQVWAEGLFPPSFGPKLRRTERPGQWTPNQWRGIARTLAFIVSESSGRVDWSTVIRPLGDWHKVALQMAARQDWNGQAHEIFSQRLGKITE